MSKSQDPFAKPLQEITRAVRHVPPSVLAVMIVVAIFVVTALSYQRFNNTPTEYELLLAGKQFSTAELLAIVHTFSSAELTDYRIENAQVLIPIASRKSYVSALASGKKLPFGFQWPIDEPVTRAPLFEAESQRTQRVKVALQQRLATTLRSMDGIADAMVQYDELRNGGFRGDKEVTAMVAVRPSEDVPLTARRIRSICETLAGAIAGLELTAVTVLNLQTGESFRGDSPRTLSRIRDEEYATLKRMYEKQLTEKVARVLEFIPRIKVATVVEIGTQPESTADGTETLDDEWDQPLVPTDVAVTVGVPCDYYLAVWRQRTAEQPKNHTASQMPPPEELQAIEAETRQEIEMTVAGLAPSSNVVRLVPRVRVVSFPPVHDLPVRVASATQMPQWSANHTTMIVLTVMVVAGVVLVLGVLFDLYRISRDVKTHRAKLTSDDDASGISRDTVRDDPDDLLHYIPMQSKPEVETTSPDEIVQTDHVAHYGLTDLVREDPDAAVAMLRSWVGKAS